MQVGGRAEGETDRANLMTLRSRRELIPLSHPGTPYISASYTTPGEGLFFIPV